MANSIAALRHSLIYFRLSKHLVTNSGSQFISADAGKCIMTIITHCCCVKFA